MYDNDVKSFWIIWMLDDVWSFVQNDASEMLEISKAGSVWMTLDEDDS